MHQRGPARKGRRPVSIVRRPNDGVLGHSCQVRTRAKHPSGPSATRKQPRQIGWPYWTEVVRLLYSWSRRRARPIRTAPKCVYTLNRKDRGERCNGPDSPPLRMGQPTHRARNNSRTPWRKRRRIFEARLYHWALKPTGCGGRARLLGTRRTRTEKLTPTRKH